MTFSTTSPGVHGGRVDGDLLAAGGCNVDANQAGAGDFDPAPQVTQMIAVTKVTSTVTVDVAPTTTVHGQPATATAHVAPALGGAAGTVQFSVDGTDLGAPVPVAGGTAAKPLPADLAAGNRSIGAAFAPTDSTTFAPATGTGTLPVGKASHGGRPGHHAEQPDSDGHRHAARRRYPDRNGRSSWSTVPRSAVRRWTAPGSRR